MSGKPEMAYLPWAELEQVALVENHGAEKYERFGWRKHTAEEHIGAALRHISARLQGRWFDDEGKQHSGQPHLAHAICRLLFALAQENEFSSLQPQKHNALEGKRKT